MRPTANGNRHIDSYNFFVEQEIKEIVQANRTIRSDVDSNFWLEYVWTIPILLLINADHVHSGLLTFESTSPDDRTIAMLKLETRSLPWSAD